METAVAEVLPSVSDDAVYVDPFTKGIQFSATLISSVEVNSQRDNQEVREKVTKAIASNKPSSKVVIIVKLNTVCIVRGLFNHTNCLLWCSRTFQRYIFLYSPKQT